MGAQVHVTPTSPFSQDFSGPFPVRLHFLGLFYFSHSTTLCRTSQLYSPPMETQVFRDVTPRWSINCCRRFGESCHFILKVKLFNIVETSADVYWWTWRNIRCHASTLEKPGIFTPATFYIPGRRNVPSGHCHRVYLVSLLALLRPAVKWSKMSAL